MLTVKYGPFHPELEAAFLERLRELAPGPGARPVAVVAPSRRLAERLERLAAVEGGLPLLGVHFHTFYSLALSVVEEAGFPDKRLLGDPVFHDRLVDSLLEQNRALGALFGGAARPRALAKALRASLRDLIDAGVSCEAVEEHFGGELLPEAHERERLAALLALARAYEARLDELGILSPSGLTRLAARGAENSAFLSRFSEVLYYGFYDLTGLQLDFFEAVASRHAAAFFFPYRKGHPAYRYAADFFEQKLLKYEVQALEAEPQARANGCTRAPSLPTLSVISASGAKDEVWAAAKEIRRLVDAEGVRYEDIGLSARTLEPYRAAVAELFEENRIPYAGPGEPLLRQPLAKAALNLLSLRRRDYPAAAVEDIFSSPYFEGAGSPRSRRRRHWKLLIRHLGIRAGLLQWRGKLEGRTGEDLELFPRGRRDGEPGLAVPQEDVRALWELVAGLNDELGRPHETWTGLCRAAWAILESRLALPQAASSSERRVWDALRGVFAEFEAFDLLGKPPAWEDFLDSLEEKLKALELEPEAACRGVRVIDAMGARGQSFRALFLIGLKEKLFPRQVLEDPLLRDSARAALRHPAGYWIARKAAGTEEERLLFHLLVSSARERLYCVYPRSDEDGKAEVPSVYLRELCREAGVSLSAPARRVARGPSAKLKELEPELLTPKEASLKLALQGEPGSDYLEAGGREGGLLELSWPIAAALNARGEPGAFDGIVGAPEDYLRRLRAAGVSPSALETFARCPFQFFAERVLGLGRHDEAAEPGDFSASIKGRIYHAALERFYGGLSQEFWSGGAARWEPELEAAMEAVFREWDWRKVGVYPVLWLAAKETIARNLRSFLAWDLADLKAANLRPMWLERELKAPLPAALPRGLEELRLKGVVDRVDADARRRRYRIVDYKTRWSRPKIAGLIKKGEAYQLPVYAELAGRALEGRAAFDGAYLHLIEDSPETTGQERSQGYERAQWELERERFFENVAVRLDEIARGRFPIRPEDGEHGRCGRCEFPSLCRKGHGPSRRRALAQEEPGG